MRHLVSAAVLLLILATLIAQVAEASGAVASWRVARFDAAAGRGAAISVVSVCTTSGGAVVSGAAGLTCGAGQTGPTADILSPRVTTVLQGRTPGETWSLELFQHGTCSSPSNVVVTLPSITIAANGRGTSRLLFSAAQYKAVAAAFSGKLILRLTHRGRSYCSPYGATLGGH
jgi:hypothetical protein